MAKRNPERRRGTRRRDEDDDDDLFPSDDDEEELDDDREAEEDRRARSRRRDDDEDDLKLDDIYEPPRPRRPVGIIDGTLSVLLTAVIALILFTLLGFVIVLGGQLAGVIEPAISQEGGSGFASAVAAAAQASANQTAQETVDPRCDLAGAWWESVRGQVAAIAGLFGNVHVIPADQRPLSLAAARAARDAIDVSEASPCLTRAKQNLSSAAREAVNVYTQVEAGNLSTYDAGRNTVELALVEMYVALWADAGFATAPNSPPALGVIRLGGVDCTSQTQQWYDQLKPSLDSLDNLIATDPNVIVGAQLRRVIGDIRAIGESVRQSAPPDCAVTARDLLIESIEAYADGFENFGAGDIQGSRGAFQGGAMAEFAFTAWMNWLGVLAL